MHALKIGAKRGPKRPPAPANDNVPAFRHRAEWRARFGLITEPVAAYLVYLLLLGGLSVIGYGMLGVLVGRWLR
jgi:hypothetical protein